MTRKAAARGRRSRAARSGKSAPGAAIRTRRKPAREKPIRASKPVARSKLGRQTAAARRETPLPESARRLDEGALDRTRPARVEEDEDLDWLGEDEDPRSQIVEDDDADSHSEEDW